MRTTGPVELPAGTYHVMSRGNRGRTLFEADDDRHCFLHALSDACLNLGWHIHAYVLMSNHYHLLVETSSDNLLRGIKNIHAIYRDSFESRHHLCGDLFQRTSKAVRVNERNPNSLLIISTYIHVNPARAGLVRVGRERLKDYPWSSYPLYLMESSTRPIWLRTETVLASLGLAVKDVRHYEEYIEGRVLELGREKHAASRMRSPARTRKVATMRRFERQRP